MRRSRHGPLVSDVSNAGGRRGPAARRHVVRAGVPVGGAATRRPDVAGRHRDRQGERLGELRRRACRTSIRRSRTSSTPTSTATSASSRRAACRCASPTTTCGGRCPRRAGTRATTGTASCRSTSCRSASTRPTDRIVTANHKVVGDDDRPFLTSEWAAPFRARRIEALLDATTGTTRRRSQRSRATCARSPRVALLPLLRRHARRMTTRKDGVDEARRPGTARCAAIARRAADLRGVDARARAARDAATSSATTSSRSYWEARTVFLINVLSDRDGQSRWCDDVSTPVVETCAQMKTRALDLALADLTRRLGPDRGRWRWDALHVRQGRAPAALARAALAPLFTLQTPIGGDGNTVDVAGYTLRDETGAVRRPTRPEPARDRRLRRPRAVALHVVDRRVRQPPVAVLREPVRTLDAGRVGADADATRSSVERGAVGTLRLTPERP